MRKSRLTEEQMVRILRETTRVLSPKNQGSREVGAPAQSQGPPHRRAGLSNERRTAEHLDTCLDAAAARFSDDAHPDPRSRGTPAKAGGSPKMVSAPGRPMKGASH